MIVIHISVLAPYHVILQGANMLLLLLMLFNIILQGAGHNDVELYNQYLERLKTFVSTELTN